MSLLSPFDGVPSPVFKGSEADAGAAAPSALDTIVELPFAKRRTTDAPAPQRVPLTIPAELSVEVGQFARSVQATGGQVWLAAFAALMHRYLGRNDLTICLPGPLPLICMGDVPFTRWVQTVRNAFLTHLANRPSDPVAVPPESLAFSYQGETPLNAEASQAGWRLHLETRPDGSQSGFVEYDASRYEAFYAGRFGGHLINLIGAGCRGPETNLFDLPVFDAIERREIVEGFNANAVDYPRERCIFQLIDEQAARTPDAIAVEDQVTTLTYRELIARADRIGAYLHSLGVRADTLVGVCVDRTVGAVAAMLGVWKAGGAYLPLDPNFPPERLALFIRDAQAPIIIAHRRLQDRLPPSNARIVYLDDPIPDVPVEPVEVKPTDLAYVLYTSGSTGLPNGAAIEHRGLMNFLAAMQRDIPLSPADRFLAITTFSFDIHHVELWQTLMAGARIVLVPRSDVADGAKLLEHLRQSGATLMQATPATWYLLIAAGWTGTPGLRLLCGGEPMPPELRQQLLARVAEVWNLYGPTETTVWSTTHRVSASDDPIPIGRPIGNMQYYILDSRMQPVPIGCVGEIWIGGDGVGRYYLNRPERTAERFLPNPFHPSEGGTSSLFYKSGDLGRYLPNGLVICLGRADFQVKIRGFRIELGEIERGLEGHPDVAQAVVVARKDADVGASLHAYLRPHPGVAAVPAAVRHYLRTKLPDYMVPATITVLEKFPLGPTGKINRNALPAPAEESVVRSVAGGGPVPPSGDVELALVRVWEEVIGIKPIGVTDDFHDIGGNSLMAAVLMAKIDSKLGHRIPLEVLSKYSTVRGLASVLEQRLELGTGSLVPLQTGGTTTPLFLIAGAGGHVFAFHQFARLLGPQFNVYGMKAIGVDGTEPPLDDFTQIAARYAKEITEAVPHGPYLLGGYSVGANIALETAIQLQRLGHQVPRLISLDMYAPGFPKSLPWHSRMGVHLGKLTKGDSRWSYIRNRLRGARTRLLNMMNLHHLDAPVIQGLDSVPRRTLSRVWGALDRGNARYRPSGVFDGQVVQINSGIRYDWEDTIVADPRKGWNEWSTQPMIVHNDFPADHMDFFKDHCVRQLADIVRSAIGE
ncbi:MAG: amino acid adenylation domain-containing protein [Planctomycetes bacterium]|nr:amino acid adenylation domain-containing protein [Planctomycetota bacterium]